MSKNGSSDFFYENVDECSAWLSNIGSCDVPITYAHLVRICESFPKSLVPILEKRLREQLEMVSDCDRASRNLERFVIQYGSQNTEKWLLQDEIPIEVLFSIFSDSQFLSDWLLTHEDEIDWLKENLNNEIDRPELVDRLESQLLGIETKQDARRILLRFKNRHLMRIAAADLVEKRYLAEVSRQLSDLADAICHATTKWIQRRLQSRWGVPRRHDRQPSDFVVLALGKLGGRELNYSSDVDLIMVYDEDGETDRNGIRTNRLFYTELTREMVQLLGDSMEGGPVYRIDMRLRPDGARGALCLSQEATCRYYDFRGRTWERQALIKARPIAGNPDLGNRILDRLRPWIFSKNLGRADITGIKALKRRIERRTIARGEEFTNIKTGHGGIRDIEFVIQFLQLLNGGELPELHQNNTLAAIESLEFVGCLTNAEATLLTKNYCWLRTLEHRLQMMHNLQTHTLPTDDRELIHIARRMGIRDLDIAGHFQRRLEETTESDRTILNHLLHNAFGMNFGSLRDSVGNLAFFDDQDVPPEVDLILEPDPDESTVSDVLLPYGFEDVRRAFECLVELSREKTPFLSPRRCRHFLASIAPALLQEIALTPDPDATLISLSAVSDSLGAKGVLWELFSFNRPTLEVYVRMCASGDYLTGILKRNPGMIDELIDALQVENLPDIQFLSESMDELTKGAEDIELILHNFKNAQHLRAGVRDILNRDDIRTTHRLLSDVAEVCLQTVTRHQYGKLLRSIGHSNFDKFEQENQCPFGVIGLGKLGGREPNYHSDLDLVFVYEPLQEFENGLPGDLSSQHFFSELAANISQFMTHSPRLGRLIDVDARLRPTGKSGPLAVSTNEFQRYFESDNSGLWERLALCKARCVFGSERLRQVVSELILGILKQTNWDAQSASQVVRTRLAMEKDCSPRNLKRGPGGTVDVEFMVQAIQLRSLSHGAGDNLFQTGTLDAIQTLVENDTVDSAIGTTLAESYRFLRSVEARLRLINTAARHDLPENELMLQKLAYLLDYESANELVASVDDVREAVRGQFEKQFQML